MRVITYAVTRLTTALDAAEAEAEAARDGDSGEWFVGYKWNVYRVEDTAPHDDEEENRLVVYGDVQAQSEHIAANSPKAVLRRIKADRELLADLLAEKHMVNDGDCWYTCPAATQERDGGETCNDGLEGEPCDCGRDERVERRIRIIAEGWGL